MWSSRKLVQWNVIVLYQFCAQASVYVPALSLSTPVLLLSSGKTHTQTKPAYWAATFAAKMTKSTTSKNCVSVIQSMSNNVRQSMRPRMSSSVRQHMRWAHIAMHNTMHTIIELFNSATMWDKVRAAVLHQLRGGLWGGPAVLQQLRRPLYLWCSKTVQTGKIDLRLNNFNFHNIINNRFQSKTVRTCQSKSVKMCRNSNATR